MIGEVVADRHGDNLGQIDAQDLGEDCVRIGISENIHVHCDENLQDYSIVDQIDREIVQLLQQDASLTAREIADHVGLTATPCWRRVQNLEASGVITRRVALVDPAKVNLDVMALVQIRTNDHSATWLERFKTAIDRFPEVVEAYRTSGEIDYVLRVVVPSIEQYDRFYKRLIEAVDLYDVRTVFVMEKMKQTTALPLHYLDV
jgi:Lrp/AsnC family transcriptional regulator